MRPALVLLLLCLARAASAARFADFVSSGYTSGAHVHGETGGESELWELRSADSGASSSGHRYNGLSVHRLQQELRGIFSHIASTAEALLPVSQPSLLPGATSTHNDATAAAEEQFQELLQDALEQGAGHRKHSAASRAAIGVSVEAGSSWKHDDAHEAGNWVHHDMQELQDALNRDASHAVRTELALVMTAVDPKPHAAGLLLPHLNELTGHSDDGHTTSITRGSNGDISTSTSSTGISYISNDAYETGDPMYEIDYEVYYDDDNNWQGDYYEDQAYDDAQMHHESRSGPSVASSSHVYFGEAARDDEAAAAADAAHLAVASSAAVARTIGAIMDAVHGGLLKAVVTGGHDEPAQQPKGDWQHSGAWEMQREPTLQQLAKHQLEQQQEQQQRERVPWEDALVNLNVDEQPMVAGSTDDDAVEVAAVRKDGSMVVVVNGNTMLLDRQGALHDMPMAFSDSLLQQGPAWMFRDESGNPNWALLAMAVLSAASAATLVAFAYSWMALREAMEAEAAVGWGSGLRLSRGSSLDALEAPLLPPVEEAAKGTSNGMHHNVLCQHVAGARQL